MKLIIILTLILPLVSSCATEQLSDSTKAQSPYDKGYNAAAKSCNYMMEYKLRYEQGSGATTSPAGSLWGLLTTPDIGYTNALARLGGQKAAINHADPLPQRTLYSQASFLNKCNYNPTYAQFCKTAYSEYIKAYQGESANLKIYDANQYTAGFNDAVKDCDAQYITPSPQKLQLK